MKSLIKTLTVFAALQLSSCQSIKSKTLNSEKTQKVSIERNVFETKDLPNTNNPTLNYVSQAVPFSSVNSLKKQIEVNTGLTLKDRGEAHITVITPPEMALLRTKLSAEKVLEGVHSENIQNETFDIKCLGKGQKKKNSKQYDTFFVVVDSKGLVSRRSQLANAFSAAGGASGQFDPVHFYPHITVGFTIDDLHEQDGVIKDQRSCIAEIDIID